MSKLLLQNCFSSYLLPFRVSLYTQSRLRLLRVKLRVKRRKWKRVKPVHPYPCQRSIVFTVNYQLSTNKRRQPLTI